MKMRDKAENPNQRGDDIERHGGRQTGCRERRRTRGDKKKEQGIRRAAIKRGKKKRKNRSAVNEIGLVQN